MKLGTRNLPKYLVERLGKDVVKAALNKPEPEVIKDSCTPHIKPTGAYAKTYNTSISTAASKKKWNEIKNRERPEDPLYSVEDALSLAGLS